MDQLCGNDRQLAKAAHYAKATYVFGINFLTGGLKSLVKTFSYQTPLFNTDLQTHSTPSTPCKLGFAGGNILILEMKLE